jgi:acetylornithine aminotransferase
MAVFKTIFDVIENEKLVEHAARLGEHAMARLRSEHKISGKVEQVRGRGLFIGIELRDEPQKLVERGLENGVVLNVTAKKVVRVAPPVNISQGDWVEGLDRLVRTLSAA